MGVISQISMVLTSCVLFQTLVRCLGTVNFDRSCGFTVCRGENKHGNVDMENIIYKHGTHQHQHQRRSSTSKICNHWKTEGVCTCCTSLRRQPYQTNWIQCSNIVKLRIELGVVLFFCAVLPPLPQNSVDEIKSVREEHRYGWTSLQYALKQGTEIWDVVALVSMVRGFKPSSKLKTCCVLFCYVVTLLHCYDDWKCRTCHCWIASPHVGISQQLCIVIPRKAMNIPLFLYLIYIYIIIYIWCETRAVLTCFDPHP